MRKGDDGMNRTNCGADPLVRGRRPRWPNRALRCSECGTQRNSAGITRLLGLLSLSLAAFGAVDGTIVNQTTGKPQPNVIVSLIEPGQGGMQTLGTAKSDAEGKFKLDKNPQGTALLQAIYQGVTYTRMLAQGAPATGVDVAVFDSSSKPGSVEMNQHMVLIQPGDKGLQINEIYLLRNTGKVTYNDPAKGALQFYLAPGHGDVRVTVGAPGGMPVQRSAQPAGPANVYKVDFPVKPGETRFDLNYSIESVTREFTGKVLSKGGDTRLVVPNGVTLEGEGIEQLGTEPQTQAKIYGAKGNSYTVKVSGTGTLSLPGGGEGDGEARAAEEDNGQPPLQQTMPRIYERLYVVLGLAGAILALGFIVLYRSRSESTPPGTKQR